MRRAIFITIFALCACATHAVDVATQDARFVDEARNREIPYAIHYQTPLVGLHPVVILSHGGGGSRYTNEHLGKYLATNGFVAIHVQHRGSDEQIYKGARNRRRSAAQISVGAADPRAAINRFLDIPFVLTQLAEMNENDATFKGHLDLAALGMAGHSFGALGTMVAAGMQVGDQYHSYPVPSLRAGVLLSPSPPGDRYDAARVYQDVAIPLFHMTGTKDSSIGAGRGVTAFDRTQPFRTLTIPDQYLLVLDQADHVTFSGERIGTRAEKALDTPHMASVLGGALMFFRAYLKDDAKARAWLRTEYRKSLAEADRFEFK